MADPLVRLLHDARYAIRRACRSPVASLLPVLVISCAIGASTALFSILELVLVRPLPFPDADRLVAIYAVHPEQRQDPGAQTSWDRGAVSWAGWQRLRAAPQFEEVGAWTSARPIWGHPGEDVVYVWYASTSLLEILGATPHLGRTFLPHEDQVRTSDAVLLSWECWQRRYAGRSDVLGTTATFTRFAGEPEVKTIVGVLPPGLKLRGDPPEFILPIGERAGNAFHDNPAVRVVGRLGPGVSTAAAADAAQIIVRQTLRNGDRTLSRVVPLRDDLLGQYAPPAWLLAATTGILVLVGCASVGGSLLSEAQSRRMEIAVRLALGGTRRAIVRQLLVEQALRGAVAMGAGLALAVGITGLAMVAIPADLVGTDRPEVSTSILLAGCALVTGAIVVFGVIPALLVSGTRPADALAALAASGVPPRSVRMQRMLAALQLSFSLVLVVCASLLGGTFGNLSSQPLGFDPARLAVVAVEVAEFPQVPAVDGQWPLFASWTHTEGLLDAVRRLPGVSRVAGVSSAPFVRPLRTTRVRGEPPEQRLEHVQVQLVTKDFFETLGVPLISGRLFLPEDRQRGPEHQYLHAVVSAEVERRLGGDAIGKRLKSDPGSYTYEIVGVVGNLKQRHLADDDLPTIYLLSATYSSINNILIRTSTDPQSVSQSILSAIREYDRSALVLRISTMDALVSDSIAGERFRAMLSVLFAGAALLLACCGIYAFGVRMVHFRSREIAIRSALGASPGRVTTLVLTDAVQVVAIALLTGLPASLAAAHLLRAFLFGVSPVTAWVWVLSTVGLSLATLVAFLQPARLAHSIDPAVLLKQ